MDLASLGFKIDTSDIQRANANLDDLNKQGSKSTATADAISKAWKDASTKMVGNTDAILVELKSLNTTQSQTAILMQKLVATVGQTTQGMKAQASAIEVSTQSVKGAGVATSEYVDRIREMVKQSTLAGSAAEAIVESQRSVAERAREAASAIDQEAKATSNWAKEQADANARGKAFNDAEDRRVKAAKASASATGLESAELEKLLARVYPLQARLKALEDDEERLTKAFKAGQLSAAQYADGIAEIGKRKDALDDVNTRANKTANGLHKLSLESAGARRELGVMLGEIAQGNWGNLEGSLSTLANRTGLFTAAMSTAGISVAALLAPVAAFGVAAYQDQARLEKFSDALKLTGSYSGITAKSLDEMARQIQGSDNDLSRSSDILANLASTGKYTSDSIKGVAQAAMYLGGTADEAASKAASMFDGTVSGAVKANEQYHYLNASLAEQIQHYQDIGDAESAVNAASAAFSDAEKARLQNWRDGLSGIPKLWDEAKSHMLDYWHEFESWSGKKYSSFSDQIGLATGTASIDAQIADLENRQKQARTDAKGYVDTWQGIVNNAFGLGFGQKEQAQLEQLYKQRAALQSNYSQQSQASKVSGQADAALPDFMSELNKFKPDSQKEQDELKKWLADSNKQIAAAMQSGDKDLVAKLEVQQSDVYQQIKASYAKKDGSSGLASSELSASLQKYKDMLSAANTAFGSYQKNLDTQYKAGLITADDYYSKMRESVSTSSDTQVAEINAEIAVLQKFHGTQQQNVEVQKQIGTLQTQAADIQAKASAQITQLGVQETAEVNKRKAAYDALTASLSQQLAVEDQRIQTQIDSVSMGSKEISQQSALSEIEQRRADQLQRYSDQFAKKQIDTSAYAADVQQVNSYFDKMRDHQIDGYAQIDKAQASWTKGASKGWEDFRDQAIDVSGQVASTVGDAFSTFTDDMVTALNTGKLSFKSFATSVLEDIERIALRLAEEKAVSSILGAFSIGGSSISVPDYSSGFSFSAKGNVFQGGNISDYSGSVVSSPTLFSGSHITAFANGGNVMGEAGPEAILPLRRGTDGKLGVASSGSSQATQVSISIKVDQSGNATSSSSGGSSDWTAAAQQMADIAQSVANKQISRALQPAGQIYNKLNGR